MDRIIPADIAKKLGIGGQQQRDRFYYPDGTPKKDAHLNAELARQIQQERKQ